MAAEAGNGSRVYVQAGDVVRVRLPYSEVEETGPAAR